MTKQELFNAVNRFDDAEWIIRYGNSYKAIKEVINDLDEDEVRELLQEYWRFMNTIMADGIK